MNIAELSIKNRLICSIVILASLIGGWIAYDTMPRFEDPEFVIRTAVVNTQYPGGTPQEVADEISEVLESAIQEMQEVDEIRSVSADGLSTINVDIKYEFSPSKSDLQLIWTKLRNKVKDAAVNLPPGAGTPFVNDDFGDVYGLYYILTGEGFTPKELSEYANDLRTEILSVKGVGKVVINGTQSEAIYVEFSRERAATLGVSIEQIYSDLASQNSVVAAGNVQIDGNRMQIQLGGKIDSVTRLSNIVISTASAGKIVRLSDVATITRGYTDPASFIMRYNGKPALGIGISAVSGTNVVEVGERIVSELSDSVKLRPWGIEVYKFYHQGEIVDASVKDFAFNVFVALCIVLATLLIFMGIKSAVVIGGVLLLTIAATLTVMNVAGIPMHRISLGALIIALGMLVDNAIVVTEGILIGVQKGISKIKIASDVVTKTKWPLLGGTLVGILAFAPIGFAPGSTAEFTGHLFWVVMISLLFSWIFAITIVPVFADLLFKEVAADSIQEKPPSKFMTFYKDFMVVLLKAKWLVVAIAVGMFACSIWGFQFIKAGFFPSSTTPIVLVDYWLPQGTDITQTNKDLTKLEEYISTLDGVDDVHTLVGGGTLRFTLVYESEPPTSSYGQILAKAESFDTVSALIPQIQKYVDANYPNAQSKAWRFQLGPGGGSKIEAEFSGPDPAILRKLANEAKAIMAQDPDAISIKDNWRQPASIIRPIYSEARGRRVGISREDLANALNSNFSGRRIGVYREEDDLIPIITRAPESERLNIENIAAIQIPSQVTGGTVPLAQVVDGFETHWQNANLRKIDRVMTIKAQTDPALGVLAAELENRLRPLIDAIPLPDGYALNWGGESGDSADANENLMSTLPLGFASMVLVVVLLFNAIRQPLLIWLTVPLSLIGVVFGLVLTGTPMEFMAILGLLSLSGLLIKNAIVLVDQMDLEISEGKERFDAVIDSAASRVRPVMMGSMTTVLGVIPLFGDAFFKSMAVVLVYGLSFATLLTLVVIPALYVIFFRISASETASNS